MKSNRAIHIVATAFALISLSVASYAEEPQDLTILRDSYQRAIERAVSPVQGKYIEELKKLKLRYTKDGKLEDAIVVDKELTKIIAAPEKADGTTKKPLTPGDPDHLLGEWFCNDAEADIFLIKSNGKAFHAADTGTWKSDEQALTINWANGFRLVIDLNQTEDTIYGKSYRPGATQYDLLKFTHKKEK